MSYYLSILQKKGLALSPLTEDVRKVEGLNSRAEQPRVNRRYYGGGHPIVALTKDGLRICCHCKVAKQPSEYSKNKNKLDGLDARCRRCKSDIARKRYAFKRMG